MAQIAGIGALRDSRPEQFESLLTTYAEMLPAYVDQFAYKKEKPRALMEAIARHLEDELRQAQKMEAMGLLAGGVAHDLNNLLLVMLLSAEILRDAAQLTTYSAEAGELIDAIERAQNLTRQLLTFSRKQPLQLEIVDIPDIVSGMKSLLRRTLPTSMEIEVDIKPPVWPVRADRSQIEQVLLNLAINARDAMTSGGIFALSVGNEALADGDYVCIRATDNGSGIEQAHLDRRPTRSSGRQVMKC